MNLFEIGYSLNRQFGSDPWCLYRGKHLLNFADNHDVTRLASILQNPAHLPLVYGLLFGMPGVPCLYYGSEWGAAGRKQDGDDALRPAVDLPQWTELTDWIAALIKARAAGTALCQGSYRQVVQTNHQLIFERKTDDQRILVAINAAADPYTAHFDAGCGMAVDLITGQPHDFGGGSTLPGYSVAYWLCER